MLQQYGGIQAYVLRIRRDLHKIPEIGLELPETEKFIKKELDALNIPYVCSERGSGIMATIEVHIPENNCVSHRHGCFAVGRGIRY